MWSTTKRRVVLVGDVLPKIIMTTEHVEGRPKEAGPIFGKLRQHAAPKKPRAVRMTICNGGTVWLFWNEIRSSVIITSKKAWMKTIDYIISFLCRYDIVPNRQPKEVVQERGLWAKPLLRMWLPISFQNHQILTGGWSTVERFTANMVQIPHQRSNDEPFDVPRYDFNEISD